MDFYHALLSSSSLSCLLYYSFYCYLPIIYFIYILFLFSPPCPCFYYSPLGFFSYSLVFLSFSPPSYTEQEIAALAARELLNPPAELTSDPYATPELFPPGM